MFTMHSSLSEFRELVAFLRPRRVEPLVCFICHGSWGGSALGSALFDDLLRPADSPESQSPAECSVGTVSRAPPSRGEDSAPSSVTAMASDAPGSCAGAISSSSTWTWATRPAPAPDTLALLHDSQWDELADHVGISALKRSLKRRRTATTELDSDSSCTDTLPDLYETPLL